MAENPPELLHTPTSKANQDSPSMRERDPGSWSGTPTAAMKRRSPEHAAGRAKNPKEAADAAANEALAESAASPTPVTHDATRPGGYKNPSLKAIVERDSLMPTPVTTDHKQHSSPSVLARKSPQLDPIVGSTPSLKLSATWVNRLMGYPDGWMEDLPPDPLAPSTLAGTAIPCKRSSSRKGGKQASPASPPTSQTA